MDTDWDYDGQEDKAFEKGMRLLETGCILSEFGTRRRRDYHTQALVFRGLVKASKEAASKGFPGELSGTSNVHLAMRFGIPPIGTVAHEWFMGTAAIFNDYRHATEEALRHWVGCFGSNLSIALTDTFGTPEFLHAFRQPARTTDGGVSAATLQKADGSAQTYAELFTGVRQDSGDPKEYVKLMRKYYDAQGIKEKVIVFSDSLDVDKCLEYKKVAEESGFLPRFGVGTFLTNDFTHRKTGTKSLPLNIVIKLSSAAGRPAIKIRYAAPREALDLHVANRMTVTILRRILETRNSFKRSRSKSPMSRIRGKRAERTPDGARKRQPSSCFMPSQFWLLAQSCIVGNDYNSIYHIQRRRLGYGLLHSIATDYCAC